MKKNNIKRYVTFSPAKIWDPFHICFKDNLFLSKFEKFLKNNKIKYKISIEQNAYFIRNEDVNNINLILLLFSDYLIKKEHHLRLIDYQTNEVISDIYHFTAEVLNARS